jgi:hypothetical protein
VLQAGSVNRLADRLHRQRLRRLHLAVPFIHHHYLGKFIGNLNKNWKIPIDRRIRHPPAMLAHLKQMQMPEQMAPVRVFRMARD